MIVVVAPTIIIGRGHPPARLGSAGVAQEPCRTRTTPRGTIHPWTRAAPIATPSSRTTHRPNRIAKFAILTTPTRSPTTSTITSTSRATWTACWTTRTTILPPATPTAPTATPAAKKRTRTARPRRTRAPTAAYAIPPASSSASRPTSGSATRVTAPSRRRASCTTWCDPGTKKSNSTRTHHSETWCWNATSPDKRTCSRSGSCRASTTRSWCY